MDSELPPGVEKEFVLDAEGQFVYILSDRSEDGKTIPLYVGQSGQIYGRLGSHLSAGRKSVSTRAKRRGLAVRRIHLLKCRDAAIKNALEARLILELNPLFNETRPCQLCAHADTTD